MEKGNILERGLMDSYNRRRGTEQIHMRIIVLAKFGQKGG